MSEHPLTSKLADVMQFHVTNEPVEDAQLDEVFALLESFDDMLQVMTFLPPTIAVRRLEYALSKFPMPDAESEQAEALAAMLLPFIPKLEDNMEGTEQRNLYRMMTDRFSAVQGYTQAAHTMSLKFLNTYRQVDDRSEDLESRACAAIITTLRLPVWEYDALNDVVPVRGLASSKKAENRELHSLLEIISTKEYEDYATFYAKHAAQVEAWELSHEELSEKSRILTLCRLAQESRNAVTFDDIAKRLHMEAGEGVEELIVKAVGLGLVAAQIDQVSGTVTMHSSHHAVFTFNQWRLLKDTLKSWKDKVAMLGERFSEVDA